jgi:hypothetical protein
LELAAVRVDFFAASRLSKRVIVLPVRSPFAEAAMPGMHVFEPKAKASIDLEPFVAENDADPIGSLSCSAFDFF